MLLINDIIPELMQEECIEGFGHIEINPHTDIKVNSRYTWEISYAPEKDIGPGGSIRITIPHFLTTPQLDDPSINGYVRIASECGIKTELRINPLYSCSFFPDGHTGKYGKSIFVSFPDGLQRGKCIKLIYGDASERSLPGAATPAFSCRTYFITAIDPDGKRTAPITGYYLLKEQAGFEITGKKAVKFSVTLPSICEQGEEVYAKVSAEDIFGNIDRHFTGEAFLLSSVKGLNIPEKLIFSHNDKGEKEFTIKNHTDKTARLEAFNKNMYGISCFSLSRKIKDKYNIYWGDYHVHTYASDGLGTVKEALDFGRYEAKLDFVAVNDHIRSSEKIWEITCRDTEEAYEPGKFATFLGVELTLEPSVCDICTLTPEKNFDITELRECERDELYHEPRVKVEEFYRIMSGRNVILIPHFHLGNGKIWEYKAPEEMKLAEVYSCWGSHEYPDCSFPSYGLTGLKEGESDKNTILELFRNGYRCGLTGGSDSHSGQPGKARWLRTRQRYFGGLTAILAEELTRESLWEALNAKRVYATTGARILVDFRINGSLMGSEIKIPKGSDIDIYIKICGATDIFITQLIRNCYVWKSFDVATYPEPPAPGTEGIFEKEITVKNIQKSEMWYLRITQIDGHMAWSSPIWIDIET